VKKRHNAINALCSDFSFKKKLNPPFSREGRVVFKLKQRGLILKFRSDHLPSTPKYLSNFVLIPKEKIYQKNRDENLKN